MQRPAPSFTTFVSRAFCRCLKVAKLFFYKSFETLLFFIESIHGKSSNPSFSVSWWFAFVIRAFIHLLVFIHSFTYGYSSIHSLACIHPFSLSLPPFFQPHTLIDQFVHSSRSWLFTDDDRHEATKPWCQESSHEGLRQNRCSEHQGGLPFDYLSVNTKNFFNLELTNNKADC